MCYTCRLRKVLVVYVPTTFFFLLIISSISCDHVRRPQLIMNYKNIHFLHYYVSIFILHLLVLMFIFIFNRLTVTVTIQLVSSVTLPLNTPEPHTASCSCIKLYFVCMATCWLWKFLVVPTTFYYWVAFLKLVIVISPHSMLLVVHLSTSSLIESMCHTCMLIHLDIDVDTGATSVILE